MKTVAQTVIEADRFYTIAAHTGNVIQAVEASKDGGTVRLGKYDHKPEQEWSFVRVGEGVYRIRNRASGKLLDLTMTGTSQMWELCPTPEGTVRLRSSWAGGKCVDTVGMGAEAGAVLQIWQEVPGADQLWTIAEVKDRAKRTAKKTAEPAVEAAPAAEAVAPAEEKKAPVKKPAARKPRTTKKAVAEPAVTAQPAAEKAEEPKAEPAAKAEAAEKPAKAPRKTTARKKAAPKAEAAAPAEKPKRTRKAPAKKAD